MQIARKGENKENYNGQYIKRRVTREEENKTEVLEEKK